MFEFYEPLSIAVPCVKEKAWIGSTHEADSLLRSRHQIAASWYRLALFIEPAMVSRYMQQAGITTASGTA